MINIDKEKELVEITGGGINVSGAILNAFKGCANTIMDIGRSLGSAIRRIAFGSLCSL
jgi:hypothetical protein